MKILVNAYNLRIGGGESVGIGVIRSLYTIKTEIQYTILVNKNKGYEQFRSKDNISIQYVPSFYTYYLFGNLFRTLYLLYITRCINPDVIFSMGNYAIPVKRKQLLFLHWPYTVYPDSIAWKKQGTFDYLKRKVRCWFIKKLLRFSTAVTVQTPLMKKQFLTYFDYSDAAVHVVESSVSELVKEPEDTELIDRIKLLKSEYPHHVYLLCLSKYYSHKNLEILLPLAEEIKRNHAAFKIFINVDPAQNNAARQLLKRIKEREVDHILINLGNIPQASIYSVYKQANGFILPTLLESFGIIYKEAMISGIPIFTSDLDFAHEACGDAAFYFNPLDHLSIYQCLIQAYENPKQLKEKTRKGEELTKQFLSWEEITKQYIRIIEEL